MRKILLLAALLLLPVAALADTALTVQPTAYGFDYAIQSDKEWVQLLWSSDVDDGNLVLYMPDGSREGHIAMPYSGAGGKVTVQVKGLNQYNLARQRVELPAAADHTAPEGTTKGGVSPLTLTETVEGFHYAFDAPGTDYMMLYYRSMQREVCFPVYPVDEAGHYEGDVICESTFARTLFKVQVRSDRGRKLREAEVRKGYLAPEAPQPQSGRLNGVVVCIDPGHQENGQYVTEPMGPGLKGKTAGKGGMAQGSVTLRREHIVVLEIGMLLRDELIRQGATVVMTREVQDVFHTNMERCQIAEDGGADIMLRLHCNSSGKKSKYGIQVYGPRNSDYAKAVAAPEEYRQMGEAMLKAMKSATGYDPEKSPGSVQLNDNYVGNNWAKMVCFLLEMGYLSNPEEDMKLSTPEYKQMLAEGIAEGIYQIAQMRHWCE